MSPRLFWLLSACGFVVAAAYAAHGELRGDEYVHFEQVQRFRQGDWRVLGDALTTIPGYHVLLAGLMRLVGADSLAAARLLSGLSGIAAVLGFHCLRRDAAGRPDYLATAQFAVLPILLPFVFLVYTDTLSLALVLWAAWAAGRSRHGLAALVLTAAMTVRQNNVLWIVLFTAPLLWRMASPWVSGAQAAGREPMTDRSSASAGPAAAIPSLAPYVLAGLAFVAYWRWNGSVSLSQAQAGMHPDFSPHAGNPAYFCVLAALLMPLQCIDAWGRFHTAARSRPWLWGLPVVLALAYGLFFQVDHPYNLGEPVALRNALLQRTQHSLAWWAVFGATAVFGAVGLLWQRWIASAAIWLWPAVLVFLALSWLIEQRYCLIPFALLLAWREPSSRRKEWITLALWLSLAVLFFWGMISGRLYL